MLYWLLAMKKAALSDIERSFFKALENPVSNSKFDDFCDKMLPLLVYSILIWKIVIVWFVVIDKFEIFDFDKIIAIVGATPEVNFDVNSWSYRITNPIEQSIECQSAQNFPKRYYINSLRMLNHARPPFVPLCDPFGAVRNLVPRKVFKMQWVTNWNTMGADWLNNWNTEFIYRRPSCSQIALWFPLHPTKATRCFRLDFEFLEDDTK